MSDDTTPCPHEGHRLGNRLCLWCEITTRDETISRLEAEVERLTRELHSVRGRILADEERTKLTGDALYAEARVAALEAVERAARDVLRYGPHVSCEDAHHGPGDEHGSMETCHPARRFIEAKSSLRAALAAVEVPRG